MKRRKNQAKIKGVWHENQSDSFLFWGMIHVISTIFYGWFMYEELGSFSRLLARWAPRRSSPLIKENRFIFRMLPYKLFIWAGPKHILNVHVDTFINTTLECQNFFWSIVFFTIYIFKNFFPSTLKTSSRHQARNFCKHYLKYGVFFMLTPMQVFPYVAL